MSVKAQNCRRETFSRLCQLPRKSFAATIATLLVALAASGFALAQNVQRDGIPRAEFESLFKQLHIKNQPWATIPWKVSVTEARELAAKTGKPIFLVVNTGNCLGFV
jgi:hypothetical protein